MGKVKVDVTPARPEDIPEILHFIAQLALFEKCPERAVATHEKLEKTLGLESEPSEHETDIGSTQLRPGQFAKCIIARVDRKPCGFAVFFYNYSTVLSIRAIG